ncbi:hypothetical protein AVEN_126915-1 [Araneus ventricosus]|uniref:Uncharacterized protein n=1 Tax=Araneus ventricosus TaxID=182803 RepID=A0A4Y2C111_ARAVE|nr:hypothetical protein AVEN_126915-1 [Araneus ventricosus]
MTRTTPYPTPTFPITSTFDVRDGKHRTHIYDEPSLESGFEPGILWFGGRGLTTKQPRPDTLIVLRKLIRLRKSQDAAESILTSYPQKSRDKQSEG